ncbi:helix-turn-helix transcriptional regulator [Marivibrio halodurans]|uniref:Helix-turn-helix transcriptional regulator n=1 Tax=Marivibrio halodurans TaxID=2039722 RepID=A0A8J7S5D6_9PROT|nr:helix-turn-helix transcriptional regulator [Marivibrio halodurans]MBP5857079.1 helix-turn-helix transcriptional regulator [Marivibrio halodurans]
MDLDSAGLGDRLRQVCALIGSKKAAADAMGVSEDMIYRYLKGETKPPLMPIVALCERAGVRVDWLASGRHPVFAEDGVADPPPAEDVRPVASMGGASSPARPRAGLMEDEIVPDAMPDPVLLAEAVTVLEEELGKLGFVLDAALKGRAVALLYQFLLVGPPDSNRERFARDLLRSL